MTSESPDQDPLEEDTRVSSLEERLEKAQNKERVRAKRVNKGPDKNYRLGSRVLAQLIGGTAGGFIVGWFLDNWLGTQPWFLLLFFFGGIIVAFRNIYRISSEPQDETPASTEEADDQGFK